MLKKLRYAWIAAALMLATATSAHAGAPDMFYGMNAQNLFDNSSSTWGPQLSAMAGGGIQLVRYDARWQNVEPNAPSNGHHSYNWGQFDSIVSALAQHSLRWYPIIDYSTNWAGVIRGDSNSEVAQNHVGDFATYANVFAQRYGRSGAFWKSHASLPYLPVIHYEIWNEENADLFLHPQTSAPEHFADLYMAARAAIKPVDPSAEVIVGGLALGTAGGGPDENEFLRRMVAHRPDMRGNTDAVALHPYQATAANTEARIAGFRATVDSLLGPQVPLEITEVGWASTSASEADRGAYLSTLADQLPRSDCNITRLIPYSWTSAEQNRSRTDDWFGIFNHNGTPKESGSAFLGSVQTMRGAAAPTATVAICHPGQPAVQPAGPSLRLRYSLGRGHSRLRVRARCPQGCRLRITLLAPRPGAPVRVGHRTTKRFSKRTRTFRFRVTHRLRRHYPVIQLQVTAVGLSGAATTRTRSVRIR
jgi:Cellulase (glycosyl hydrolase family 5)